MKTNSKLDELVGAATELLIVVDPLHPKHEEALEIEAEHAASDERHPSFEHMKDNARRRLYRALEAVQS